MITYSVKCPHCGARQPIEVNIIEDKKHPSMNNHRIEAPYITCDMCMETFEVEISIKIKTRKEVNHD